jgi:hypothetical protein
LFIKDLLKRKEAKKSSQQKTAPHTAGRRLDLWQAPALLTIVML